MTQTMNDNKGNMFGMVLTGFFAWLSKAVAHFEAHASTYAAAAAIVVSIVTLANIFFGPFSKKRQKQTED